MEKYGTTTGTKVTVVRRDGKVVSKTFVTPSGRTRRITFDEQGQATATFEYKTGDVDVMAGDVQRAEAEVGRASTRLTGRETAGELVRKSREISRRHAVDEMAVTERLTRESQARREIRVDPDKPIKQEVRRISLERDIPIKRVEKALTPGIKSNLLSIDEARNQQQKIIREEREQQAIAKEKGKGLDIQIGPDIVTPIKEAMFKADIKLAPYTKKLPKWEPEEDDIFLTQFAKEYYGYFKDKPIQATTSLVIGTGIALYTRKMPSIAASLPSRVAMTSVGAAYGVSKVEEYKYTPKGEKWGFLGETAAELTAFGGGLFIGGKVPGTIEIYKIGRTRGVGVSPKEGTGYPIVSYTPRAIVTKMVGGKEVKVTPRLYKQEPFSVPKTRVELGTPKKISEVEVGYQPVTATETTIFVKRAEQFIKEPSEMLIEGRKISPELQQEFAVKGIGALKETAKLKSPYYSKELLFKEGTKYLTAKESKVIYKEIGKRRGKVFGSFASRPELKPELIRELGDIEAMFKTTSEPKLKSITEGIYQKLKKTSPKSKFRILEEEPFHIEKQVKGEWVKAAEFKGKGIGEGDVAPEKAFGYDLWASKDFQRRSGTKKAMLRGETKRKAAGSIAIRQKDALGVAHTGRFKDVTDYFRHIETLSEAKLKTPKAKEFLKLKEKLGVKYGEEPFKFEISSKFPEGKKLRLPSYLPPSAKIKSVSPSLSNLSYSISPKPSPKRKSPSLMPSPSVSPSPLMSPSPSPSPLPSISPSPSPSPYPSPLPSPSPSPSTSPRPSPSPSPSPRPSPSPSPSPRPGKPGTPPGLLGWKRRGDIEKTAYTVHVKSKGKFNKVPGKYSRFGALSRGSYLVDHSTARTFRIDKSKKKSRGLRGGTYWAMHQSKFRSYRKKKGVKVPMKEMFIEKTAHNIDTSGEIRGIPYEGLLAQKRQRATFFGAKPKKKKSKKKFISLF